MARDCADLLQRAQRQRLDDIRERQQGEPEALEDVGQRAADRVGLGLDVHVEQRAPDDREREAHHFG